MIDSVSSSLEDVPFEFVGKIASAGAVAEASYVEGGAAATRHFRGEVKVGVKKERSLCAVQATKSWVLWG